MATRPVTNQPVQHQQQPKDISWSRVFGATLGLFGAACFISAVAMACNKNRLSDLGVALINPLANSGIVIGLFGFAVYKFGAGQQKQNNESIQVLAEDQNARQARIAEMEGQLRARDQAVTELRMAQAALKQAREASQDHSVRFVAGQFQPAKQAAERFSQAYAAASGELQTAAAPQERTLPISNTGQRFGKTIWGIGAVTLLTALGLYITRELGKLNEMGEGAMRTAFQVGLVVTVIGMGAYYFGKSDFNSSIDNIRRLAEQSRTDVERMRELEETLKARHEIAQRFLTELQGMQAVWARHRTPDADQQAEQLRPLNQAAAQFGAAYAQKMVAPIQAG